MADRDFLVKLTKSLVAEGKLIEAGWIGFRLAFVPVGATKEQLVAMRHAYLGGAQHLWSSCMVSLDEGEEPTADDLKRMQLIADELDAWEQQVRSLRREEKGPMQ